MARRAEARLTSPRRISLRGLAPLRHRGFRLLAGGQAASNVGDACYAVALPWYVLAEHGGVVLLGGVLVAYGVPRTAALAVGGHASDRWRPWTVMMSADAVRGLAVGALAVAASLGPARAIVLVPIAVLLGSGEGMFLPGSFAIVPALLPDEDLQSGNALASGGTQLATLVGPAIGGALVGFLGPAPAFALDAASFAVSALALLGVRTAERPLAPERSAAPEIPAVPGRPAVPAVTPAAEDLSAGPAAAPDPGSATPTLRAMVRTERVLQVILVVNFAANLGLGGMSEVALPALAHGPLRAGAAGYGGLLAAFAAGALVGTLAAGQLRRARRPAMVGSAAFLGEGLLTVAVPYLGGTLAAGAALAAVGVANGFGNVVMITAFQRWAPSAVLGRLMGLLMLTSFGVFPISVALAALVVHGVSPAAFFPVAGGTLAIAILAGLTQRSWRGFGAGLPAPAPAAGPAATAGGPA